MTRLPLEQQIAAAKQCVRPAVAYFRRQYSHRDVDLYYLVIAFKAARLCDIFFVGDSSPAQVVVDGVR